MRQATADLRATGLFQLIPVNPHHMYTGNLNPEWVIFNEANKPMLTDDKDLVHGKIYDLDDYDVVEQWYIYSIVNNYWVEKEPSDIKGHRFLLRKKIEKASKCIQLLEEVRNQVTE